MIKKISEKVLSFVTVITFALAPVRGCRWMGMMKVVIVSANGNDIQCFVMGRGREGRWNRFLFYRRPNVLDGVEGHGSAFFDRFFASYKDGKLRVSVVIHF